MLTDAYNIFIKYAPFLWMGTLSTLLLSFTGTIIGAVIGFITGAIRTTPYSDKAFVRFIQKIINFLIAIYVEVFRGTPMMVQSMVIYWGYAFAHGGETLDLTLSGILIISINTGAYMTEIVRGGIISIDPGQSEGAASIGMTHWQTMLKVVFPQVLRNIIPATSNELLNNIKDSSVLNVIGVTELFFYSGMIKRKSFMVFQTYIVICVIYLIITFTVTQILRKCEKLLDGDENFQIVRAAEVVKKKED